MIQGTQEWLDARRGKITASRFDCVLVKGRNKEQPFGDSAMTYLYELVGERLTSVTYPELETVAIQWGHENEENSRACYQWRTGNNIATFGFVSLNEDVGGSPDGVIADQDGIIEIKCPWTQKEHIRTLATREVPKKYIPQVQGNLWVTGRKFCDFVSYDPRFGPALDHLKLCVIRVERDEVYIQKLAERVSEFAKLLRETEERLRNDRPESRQSA